MILEFGNFTPRIDGTCFIAENSSVIGDVTLGPNSSVWFNAVIRGDIAPIRIGSSTNIQDGALLHCMEGIDLNIGNGVTIGHGAILHSCTVGDNSLIGMGAILLDGAVIGKNCLIGAGAVVTPNSVIPDGMMVLGSPAKVKRELTPEEKENIKENAKEYIRLSGVYTK